MRATALACRRRGGFSDQLHRQVEGRGKRPGGGDAAVFDQHRRGVDARARKAVMAFAAIARGLVVANHLEAISHCPVTRASLRAAGQGAGLGAPLMVPADGATMRFDAVSALAS
jgi:hypothetical protein